MNVMDHHAPEADTKRPRLLIADDERLTRAVYLRALGDGGFACDVAEDGHMAFRMATRRPYALVILDLNMPDWNGQEVVETLSLVDGGQRILVVSGHLNPETRAFLDTHPMVVGTLEKPVAIPLLLQTVWASIA